MIKIFIGTEPVQWLPTQVLKHSVIKRTKTPVEFVKMIGMKLNLKLKMYTGFSFYRFTIPEQCDFKGRAIYLDADMVCLSDINDLWEIDMDRKPALARVMDSEGFLTSCMLLQCDELKHWKVKEWVALINAGITNYQGCMEGRPNGMNHDDFGPLPEVWNHFDFYDDTTKIIHYTNVPTQPWKRAGHPFRGAFLNELKACIDEGMITTEDVEKEIKKEHIYPNILRDMDDYIASKTM